MAKMQDKNDQHIAAILRNLDAASDKSLVMQANISRIEASFTNVINRVIRVESRVEEVERKAIVTATVQAGQDKFATTIMQRDAERTTELSTCKGKIKELQAELKEDVAHRKRAGGTIVRFTSRRACGEVYDKRFGLKGLCATAFGSERRSQIYLNESLTFDTACLMKQVRDKTRVYNNALGADQQAMKAVVRMERGVIKIKMPGPPGTNRRFIKVYTEDDIPDI